MLIIEPGLGTGEIGGESGRKLNEPFINDGEGVTLEFSHVDSVRIVIEQLQTIEAALFGHDD
jgi:hypothetical protein